MSAMGQLVPDRDGLLFVLAEEHWQSVRRSKAARLKAMSIIQWAADASGLPVRAVTAPGKPALLETLPGVVELT